ncbi:hypothetical protein [Aurantimonas endophytica]|uniref:Uncharacterized protein n=1 Tax=Aurantimonas endophytica TaxID=1522175 RepID=A0A7W6HGS7_9HYPH|nr:hypothetical protein [Aurantimonas endophytica]MBB4004726.1 hypothetical protein [Aurantimonas endophytica]MCO6405541.1 hypothetical protein [Aurantimonas endophytica]
MSNIKSHASKENSVFEDPESLYVNTGKKLPPKGVDESLGEAIDETMDEETQIPDHDPARERSR